MQTDIAHIAHTPILNYQNFERLVYLYLQQCVFLNNHVVALVVLLFLLLFLFSNYGFTIQEILSWQLLRA